MVKSIIKKCKQLVAFVIIATMITPHTAFAAEAELSHELHYEPSQPELTTIEPYAFDPSMIFDYNQIPREDPPIRMSDLHMERNNLTELSPEAVEELQRVHALTYGSREAERVKCQPPSSEL